MSKKKEMLVAGKDCKNCIYYSDADGSVRCKKREKTYTYGQYVPCTDKESRQ